MASIEQLLTEAERIRTEYAQTTDSAVRERLTVRYQEIDRELAELRAKPPTAAHSSESKISKVSTSAAGIMSPRSADLLKLITGASEITDRDIAELKTWLDEAEHSQPKALFFLREVAAPIWERERYRSLDRRGSQSAIESVLPPSLWSFAQNEDMLFDVLKSHDENKRRAKALKPGEPRVFLLADCVDVDRFADGTKYAAFARSRHYDMSAYLVRDPANTYGPSTMAVFMKNGLQIGYLPEKEAGIIAPLFDAGHVYKAEVSFRPGLPQKFHPVISVCVLYSKVARFGYLTKDNRPPPPPLPKKKQGWLGWLRRVKK